MIKLNNFGNSVLFAEREDTKVITLKEYKKLMERTGGTLCEDGLGDKVYQMNYINYYLANPNEKTKVGYSYDTGVISLDTKNSAPNLIGRILKVESLPVNDQTIRAKIISDIFYTAYYVDRNKLSLDGIRGFYEAFSLALDSRHLKVLKEHIKRNTVQHYDVSYTDLRLIILSYYCTAMGLDLDLDCAVTHGPDLGYVTIPKMLDIVSYNRFVNKDKLNKVLN